MIAIFFSPAGGWNCCFLDGSNSSRVTWLQWFMTHRSRGRVVIKPWLNNRLHQGCVCVCVCVCAGPFRKSVGFVLPRMPELTEEQAMNQFFSMSVSNSATAKGLWVFGPLFGAFAQTVWIQIVWTKRFESDNVAYKFQLPFQIESRQACGTSMKAWGLNASCLAPLCYLPPGLSLLRGHWEWDDSAGRFWEGMARSIVCLFLLKDKDLVVEVWGSFKWCFRD